MTTLLGELEWDTLADRRRAHRLTVLYKALHRDIAINIPGYIQLNTRNTRNGHEQQYMPISTSLNAKNQFLPPHCHGLEPSATRSTEQ